MKESKNNVSNTSSGFRVMLILLGIAMTPVLLSSSSIGNQLDGNDLIKVVIIGGLILTILAALTMSIGEKAKLPTYGIVKYPFGEKGAIATNILMAISLMGWIIVTANQFGYALHDLLKNHDIVISPMILIALGCIIFVGATAFGFNVLGKISLIAIPIIVIMLCFILFKTLSSHIDIHTTTNMNIGVAVSTVVGTIIVLVTTSADFGSFVHNRKHALIAAILMFALAYPLLFWIGATPSQLSGKGDLLAAATVLGILVPASILMVFATFTGNTGNIFQGTLVFSTLFPSIAKWKITVIIGIVAAIVANLDILSWFIPFLLFLGIATPPIAGIYIADFFVYRRKQGYNEAVLAKEASIKWLTFLAWIIGSLVGFMTVNQYMTLTGIPSLDSILVACLCYLLFSRLQQSK